MKKLHLITILALTAVFLLALILAAGPAGATPTYNGLLPADQAAKGCAACHDGATTKDTLNALGKKVAAAAPKTKDDMAKLLGPAKPAEQPKADKPAPAASSAKEPAAKATAAPAKVSTGGAKVKLNVSGKAVSVDGTLVNKRTLVAVRALADLLGASVEWDAAKKAATISKGNQTVVFTIGKASAQVNGKDAKLDVSARLVNGQTMVPLRFLAESLGAAVDYGKDGITIGAAAATAGKGSNASILSQLIDKSGALPGYIGTQTCKTCHPDKYDAWLTTGHSRHVRDISQPGVTNANFAIAKIDPSNLLLAIGDMPGGTEQFFVDKNFKYLGKGWDPEKQMWFNDPKHEGNDYRGCARCHTVGFNDKTQKAVELNIGCENCHGPGQEHVAGGGDKSKIKVSASNDVCGKCHGQQKQLEAMGQAWAKDGKAKDGHADHFKNLLEGNPTYSDACTKCHSATVFLALKEGKKPPTLQDFKTGAYKNDRMGITCVVCHSPHKKTQEAQLRKDVQVTCLQCHTADKAVESGVKVNHAQKEFFEGKGIGVSVKPKMEAQCVDCHMVNPALNHYFMVGTPTATIMDKSGKPVEINSCGKCHATMTKEDIKNMQHAVKTKLDELNKITTAAKTKLEAAQKANKDVTAAKKLYDASYTNLSLIAADNSEGMHNYSFAKALLAKAEEDLAAFNKLLP